VRYVHFSSFVSNLELHARCGLVVEFIVAIGYFIEDLDDRL
jgi:hypothetical protein